MKFKFDIVVDGNTNTTKISIRKSDAVKIARSVANAEKYMGWGEIACQKKMPGQNIWWFSCSGHGGYVAVLMPGDGITVPVGYEPIMTGSYGLKVYAFEEDCDWAILDYFNESVFAWSLASVAAKSYDRQKMFDDVLNTMINWHPEFVKQEHVDIAEQIYRNAISEYSKQLEDARVKGEDGGIKWTTRMLEEKQKYMGKLKKVS